MSIVSEYIRRKRLKFALNEMPANAAILEIGSGEGWVKPVLTKYGCGNYTELDLKPPADIIGDIKQWRNLGLPASSFDVIIAFEIVEHVDCIQECYDLLKPGGKLLITTPVPHADWIMLILEYLGINQKRSSPHNHLVYLNRVKHQQKWVEVKVQYFLGIHQWAVITKDKDAI